MSQITLRTIATFCEHTAEMLEGVSLPILIGAPDEPHLTNSFVRWE
ncbi:MAG: hypothetical protein WBW00_14445 [Pseudolabrys sp.]|jgi:hypothetical protein